MAPQVEVQPLSRTKRRFVFGLSMLLFVVAVPVSVFYATGYRFDFSDKFDSIKQVGGLYVRNDVSGTEMFINDAPVVDMRVFQKASYIQNLTAGKHKVHVQGSGLQTWVKELPVYAHLVTEVASFNVPKTPQVRVITPWLDALSREGVVFDTATTTELAGSVITNTLRFSSTTATTTFVANSEYKYIESLFASSTEQKQILTLQTKTATPKKPTFDVATSSALLQFATTTKVSGEVTLAERGGEVFASWKGSLSSIPYYYCLQYRGEKETEIEYGAHVLQSLLTKYGTSSALIPLEGERVCRDGVRIDRLGQTAHWFDFYPDSSDLVLMLLDDGLYVVEIDDRGWQNTQQLFPGENIEAIVDGGRIFVKQDSLIFEVFTEIVGGQ